MHLHWKRQCWEPLASIAVRSIMMKTTFLNGIFSFYGKSQWQSIWKRENILFFYSFNSMYIYLMLQAANYLCRNNNSRSSENCVFIFYITEFYLFLNRNQELIHKFFLHSKIIALFSILQRYHAKKRINIWRRNLQVFSK